ncbi:hypothetical protein K9M59_00055 [Candidatus Gracilibacteria bacterium]|nr:hypothetical protein [Candidatus Gracilibacteria bacterium]MCF7818979.1 hypothetical protein [Candidatus Gracilibacteria bacterium]
MFFSLLLAGNLFFSDFLSLAPSYHASPTQYHAWKRERKNVIPRQKPFVELKAPWDGHFSAKNFSLRGTDSLQLQNIKHDLKKALLSLPFQHTEKLHNLEIRNQSHLSRGMANSKKLILHTRSIADSDELISVFIHEMGHIVDLGYLRSINGGKTEFQDGDIPIFEDDPSVYFYRLSWLSAKEKKSSAHREDFVSGYAMENCFEDFAESYLMYRLHGEKFRHLMKESDLLTQKYEFLKTEVFDGQEFQTNKLNLSDFDKKFWDATLLNIDSENLIGKQ